MRKNLAKVRERAKRLALARDFRNDQEFLPAAVSILETPPSPIHVALIWVICLLATTTLLWGYFSRIDIIAIAQGKVQPTGRVKTIQPLETGRVLAVHVENGQHVEAGDMLVELDAAEARADETAAESALAAALAEKLRRRAALDAAEKGSFATPPVAWPEEVPLDIREREKRVLEGDLEQLDASVQSLDAQVLQKKEEERRLEATLREQEALVDTLGQRVTMRKNLLARGSAPKAAVIDAIEAQQAQLATLASQKGQLAETRAALGVLARERRKTVDSFLAENAQKLAEVERQIDDLRQKRVKAHEKSGHMTLRSPIAGTVLGVSVTTKNQVLTTSEELMRIVPDGATLEIEAYLPNKDIGFVAPGQSAVVKVEAFPFTRYGTLDAHVTRVAHDAVPEPDAQQAEGNPARGQKSQGLAGGQRMQNLVFPVTLVTERTSMNIDGVEVPLTPGMAVSVEVKTGKRRILEYLFSPLVETTSRALKER